MRCCFFFGRREKDRSFRNEMGVGQFLKYLSKMCGYPDNYGLSHSQSNSCCLGSILVETDEDCFSFRTTRKIVKSTTYLLSGGKPTV